MTGSGCRCRRGGLRVGAPETERLVVMMGLRRSSAA